MRLLMASPERLAIVRQQQEILLRKAVAEDLAHGANFPLERICHYCSPHARVVEFGSADGRKLQALRRAELRVFGLEINPEAVELSWDQDAAVTFIADVRSLTQKGDHPFALYPFIEKEDAVLIQGLFANIPVDADVRRIIRLAEVLLLPKGHLFIAEPIHFSELSLFPFELPSLYKGPSLEEWQRRWFERYRVNAEAGLPYGVFAVSKGGLPKEEKYRLDWATNPEAITELIASDNFERYARHTRFVWLRRYLNKYHFREIETKPTVMPDRHGNPLIGVVSTWERETSHFRFRPFLRGARVDDNVKQREQLMRLLEDVDTPQEYFQQFIALAQQFLPPSLQKVVE